MTAIRGFCNGHVTSNKKDKKQKNNIIKDQEKKTKKVRHKKAGETNKTHKYIRMRCIINYKSFFVSVNAAFRGREKSARLAIMTSKRC